MYLYFAIIATYAGDIGTMTSECSSRTERDTLAVAMPAAVVGPPTLALEAMRSSLREKPNRSPIPEEGHMPKADSERKQFSYYGQGYVRNYKVI